MRKTSPPRCSAPALGPLRLDVSKGEARAYLLMTAQTVLASHWRRRLGQPVTFLDPATDLELLSDSPAAENLGTRTHSRWREFSQRSRNAIAGSSTPLPRGVFDQGSGRHHGHSVANAKVLQHRALRMAAKLAAEVEQ